MTGEEELAAARRRVEEHPEDRAAWLDLERLLVRYGRPLPAELLEGRIDPAIVALGESSVGPLSVAVEAWADEAVEAFLEGDGAGGFLGYRLRELPKAIRTRVLERPEAREPLSLSPSEVLPLERSRARHLRRRLELLLALVGGAT